ncbi:MAG: exodeoxyribonuclease VII small subunit [Ruminococcaceae bacterium]|nr:exodeoxyribonuclease VII small subunit [Oscillospiraceae bacterium]
MAENKEKTFEEAMARLEEIVRALDGGAAGLDDSLGLFEEGIALVKLCNSKLEGAEQKVKLLAKGEDGNLAETDFAGGAK